MNYFVNFMWLLSALAMAAQFSVTGTATADQINNQIFNFQSSITSHSGGPLDLEAELHYDTTFTNAPIAVVMHSYSTAAGGAYVRTQAQRLRNQGFFAVAVSLRGRGGSEGIRDSGGLEIYDIYDAVQAVRAEAAFASLIDPSNVHITGYSGGGGNVMSALTKFPDTFRVGSAYFGMSDYGFDPVNGWYNNGANVMGTRTPQLNADIGNPNTGGSAVIDRYHARASNLASMNNPYSEIHLFVDSNEAISPPINSISYRDNAIAAASVPGEFDNITVHIGDPTGNTYVDFNNNGVNDPNEQQQWPHGLPNANRQAAAEQWYVSRLLDGSIPQPVLNNADELFVAGYIVTSPFSLFLGSGEDTAGQLSYSLAAAEKSFVLEILSSDQSKTGNLTLDTSDMTGTTIDVTLNGSLFERVIATDQYQYSGLSHGDTLTIRAVPEPMSLVLLALGGLGMLCRRCRARLM